jgi:beta-xylosidase
MWGGDNVTKVVYTSTAPDASAPWTLVKTYTSTSPMADGYANSGDIGDLGSFIDDDGKIYIIYNHHSDSNTAFSQLDPATLTNTLGPGVNNASYTLAGEAHTVFKRGRTYFYMYSGLTGLNYNLNHYATASSPIGPWRGNTNPFQPNTSPPANLSFNSQTDQVIKIPGRGGDAYIWISDDLQPASNSEAFATKLIMPSSSRAALRIL